jgi:UDP-N-acetylmuramoylalanine--D-glutamate ligase
LIKEFTGFPHRLEYVGCFGGVYFINDSKATNVDATLQALKGLTGSIILILGGRHKGASYTPLIPYIKEKVKCLILMGEARYIMAEELRDLTETFMVENLQKAVALALKMAEPGDMVLLSPACSSFDQFKSYEERGDAFRELVFRYAPLFLKEGTKEVYH